MDFKSWWDAGFRDLIPIIPPDAEISPLSKIRPEHRGKVPGRPNGHGSWGGFDWRRHQTTEADLARWTRADAGIGLRTARFPALDIDVMEPGVAELIEAVALRVLGPAPRRVGRAPKRILAYRTKEPFGRMRLWFGPARGEHEHLVELLGDGEQYVVAGAHPGTRRPYAWDAVPASAEALTEIDQAAVEALFTELEGVLPEHGFATTREGTGRAGADRGRIDQEELQGDVDRVAAAVALIPNTNELFPSRTEYLRMGYAIKAACAADPGRAIEIWHDWAARWEGNDRFPQGNDLEVVEADWERMKGPFSVGARWIYEQARPFGFNAAGEEFQALEEAPPERPEWRPEWMPIEFSCAALAIRFVKEHNTRVRFVNATGRWRIWDGARWAEDDTERAYDLVVRLCCAASNRALKTIAQATKAERVAMKVADGSTITKVHRIARTSGQLACSPGVWDTNPWILNTAVAVVDLRTGERRPHDPALCCSKMAVVGPEPIPIPLWRQFLNEITRSDQELQTYLQRVAGYSLTGSTRDHALFFGYGGGGNGKGVFLNTISRIMGDYAVTATMEAFAASSYDRHSTELAMLHGARFVTARETEADRYWAESRIKQITGGDPITARFLYRDNFTFQPAFKLFVVGNHMPKLRNVDDAIKRRMHMIPFLFKPSVVNTQLEEQLEAEWPGILHWMIEGCLEWQRIGLRRPAVVEEATEEYLGGEDLIGRWLEERCPQEPGAFTLTQDLFEDWQEWCAGNGEKPGTKITFGRALSGRGVAKARETNPDGSAGRRGFALALRSTAGAFSARVY